MITRRTFCRAGSVLLGSLFAPVRRGRALSNGSAPSPWRQGLSPYGSLKYPEGFAHFDYINARAPKGGTVRQAALGTYDNFNSVVAGRKGRLAAGVSLLYDTLLTASLDEPSSAYGLLAEAVAHPADFSSVAYRLRPEAKWHDGRPIVPEDVIFSFEAFKKTNPQLAAYYRHVIGAEQTGEREVTFTFDSSGDRELPQIVGELTVLPKHWWEATDRSGRTRDIAATTLEPPLGSGPYRIKDFEAGRSVSYERVASYWGRNLNVRIGQDNFEKLRFDYFRDSTVAFEAFKGDELDWHEENSAKNWARGYRFPAVEEKHVLLEEFPIRSVGIMQAFAFNLRRRKFRDPRLRRAFNFAFDFESVNDEIFFGQYKRIASYFEGTELASSGLPSGQELAILEGVRQQMPPEVFSEPYWNPVAGSDEAARRNLLEAMRLLEAAGFAVRDFRLVDTSTGEPLKLEFLLADPALERFVLPYKEALQRLGIAVTVRPVDDVQYQTRLREWDFDIVVTSWLETLSPGNEQRDYWGSRAAAMPGSRNIVGIANPAVDRLIERLVLAKDRDELVATARALDRVLLWNHYVVPQWTYGKVRSARWDRFGKPDRMPVYGAAAFPAIWWWDDSRAKRTTAAR
jgi:microcin C transport system substrate-binding protein